MAKGKPMPVGVRKGGTRYPLYSLLEAVPWSRKLVSKTHLGPQPQDVVLAGVVDAKSSTGEIRVSALKQYDLMEGTSKAYQATTLAKAIASAPEDELKALLRQAALHPPVFRGLYETFHGDEVSIAKLRQRASDLTVHPDKVEACVQIYLASLEYAGLLTLVGDKAVHKPVQAGAVLSSTEPNDTLSDDELGESSEEEPPESEVEDKQEIPEGVSRPRAVFHVNVNLDASLDTEKLQKQLDLLKKYGAI